MGTHRRTVDAPEVPVGLAVGFQSGLQTVEGAVDLRAMEAVVGGLPGTKTFGQVAPRRTGVEDSENGIENRAMITGGSTAASLRRSICDMIDYGTKFFTKIEWEMWFL